MTKCFRIENKGTKVGAFPNSCSFWAEYIFTKEYLSFPVCIICILDIAYFLDFNHERRT